MPKTISDVPKELCTGCEACSNICKAKAIVIAEDKDGFCYPKVNENKCKDCSLCYEICPAMHRSTQNTKTPQLFAVRASDEIRAVSSSGGMFSVLAEWIFEKKGYVCGAAFDENMDLRHILVNNKNDLESLRGSKYVQSRIKDIYQKIETFLKNGRYVLFSGTPCQVAGLKSYLKKEYKTLFTMDVLCHGVPSQKIFHQYLREEFKGKTVTDVHFRDKRFGWSADHILVRFDDGSEYTADNKKDPYLIGFFRNITLRESCGECQFSEFPRQGDISVGDFWGITKLDKSQHDGKGTSLLYINSPKGKSLFSEISDKLSIKEFDFSSTEIKNRIHKHYPINANRYRLFKFMENNRIAFKPALQKALYRRFDIGLVSNYYAGNFGGSLTQYALFHVLEDMGYSCVMIERPADAPGKASLNTIKSIYIDFPYPNAAISVQRKSKEQMRDLNRYIDTFVVGSDQLFQYSLYNALGRFVALDWVEREKKKIAVAASYGHDRVWGDPKILAELGYYMRQFDAFSVREKSGVEISKNNFGVDAEWILDPVFLCDRKHYDSLIKKSSRKLPKKVIGSYILDPTVDKAEILKIVQKKLGCKAQIFSEFHHADAYVEPLKGLDVEHLRVEERLQLISECDFFVTDSFHGTCFAIIMGKPFISIKNNKRGGSRFDSLLSMFGLQDRLILTSQDISDHENIFEAIDYEKVNAILNSERKRCLEWIRTALTSEKKIEYTDYDILLKLIQAQQEKINELTATINNIKEQFPQQLSDINEPVTYLEKLKEHTADNIIVISVKDTPGLSLNDEISCLLQDNGLKTDLKNKHWKSFAAIVDNGNTDFEMLSDDKITQSVTIGDTDILIKSANLKAGNIASITVNGKECAVNRRGFNIVVFNKITGNIIDSVSLDFHLRDFVLSRA